jgi:hypothetical protein
VDHSRALIYHRPHEREPKGFHAFTLPPSRWYANFVQQEYAASYGLDSYAVFAVGNLAPEERLYLREIFGLLSEISTQADDSRLCAGKLCSLLGYWILGATVSDTVMSSIELYQTWQDAGRQVEHLLYAWIR